MSISAECSSLTCPHLDIPNTTERNVVVWAAGQGGAGRADQRLHPPSTPTTTRDRTPPTSSASCRTQIGLIIFSIIAWLRVLLCRPLKGLVLFKVTLRLLILML